MTDPACAVSWVLEPQVRRLMVEFGADLQWSWVVGGLAREIDDPEAMARTWLDEAAASGMPFDTRLWREGPIRSSYPACMAVVAAAEQAADGGYAYLRSVREGLMCLRRKLDTAEALVEEARRVGLDVERFRVDLESHAIVETFGAHMEVARAVPEGAPAVDGRLPFPSALFAAQDGSTRAVYGRAGYDELRTAAIEAGARPSPSPWLDVPGALARFGRLADVEVEAVCDLPEPRAQAELWRLALEWRARPERVLTGRLWAAS